jgi:hypothetical protein
MRARPANFALELTRGPFAGKGEANCTASRRLHFASSGGAVGRGSRRAAGGRRGWPARSSATGVRRIGPSTPRGLLLNRFLFCTESTTTKPVPVQWACRRLVPRAPKHGFGHRPFAPRRPRRLRPLLCPVGYFIGAGPNQRCRCESHGVASAVPRWHG